MSHSYCTLWDVLFLQTPVAPPPLGFFRPPLKWQHPRGLPGHSICHPWSPTVLFISSLPLFFMVLITQYTGYLFVGCLLYPTPNIPCIYLLIISPSLHHSPVRSMRAEGWPILFLAAPQQPDGCLAHSGLTQDLLNEGMIPQCFV